MDKHRGPRAWRMVVAAWILVAAGQAQAEERLGILSVVGDRLSLVTRADAVSSHPDGDRREEVHIEDRAVDKLVLLSADRVLRKLRAPSQPEPVLLEATDPALHALQDDLLAAGDGKAAAREGLQAMLRKAQVSKLLLITRYRADATALLKGLRTGDGKIAGLGFYLERRELKDTRTGERGRGFVAPYAYLKLSLVDAETLRMEREVAATESRTAMLRLASSADRLWDALGEDDKRRELVRVVDAAMNRALPLLMAR